jgi:hypothetical protein
MRDRLEEIYPNEVKFLGDIWILFTDGPAYIGSDKESGARLWIESQLEPEGVPRWYSGDEMRSVLIKTKPDARGVTPAVRWDVVGRRAANVRDRPRADVAARLFAARRAPRLAGHRAAGLLPRRTRIRPSGLTVAIVEQNVRRVLRVVDRAYLLEAGNHPHERRRPGSCWRARPFTKPTSGSECPREDGTSVSPIAPSEEPATLCLLPRLRGGVGVRAARGSRVRPTALL